MRAPARGTATTARNLPTRSEGRQSGTPNPHAATDPPAQQQRTPCAVSTRRPAPATSTKRRLPATVATIASGLVLASLIAAPAHAIGVPSGPARATLNAVPARPAPATLHDPAATDTASSGSSFDWADAGAGAGVALAAAGLLAGAAIAARRGREQRTSTP